jgi:hypothetical protein
MPIKYERVTVTAGLAKQWLGVNHEDNRLPKTSKIPMYARDMLSGRWNSDTGETIKFDTYGTLIDGQNRLRAVLIASVTDPDVSIDFDVARGCPPEAMQVIDTGSARTFADKLRMAGVTDRMRASGVIRWVLNWDAGNYMGRGGFSPTDSELWDRYRTEPERFDAATKRSSDGVRVGLGTASVLGTGFYLMHRVGGSDAHTFFEQLLTGVRLETGDAALTLRNRLLKAKKDRLTRQEQLALLIRGWNFYRNDEKTYKLTVVKGELSNENFPKPR